MIEYYTGVPGSGKSYRAVDTIFNNFSDHPKANKKLKKDYLNCYTNINGLKLDMLTNVYKLDFDLLMKLLTRLHTHYKAKKSDDYLIKLCKRYKIYKTLFILDEAHNFFDTPNTVLVWWFTYHRHLYHDLMLITQSLSLIHAKYKPLAEAFYKAVPKTLSLNPLVFSYKMYVEQRMSKISQGGVVKVKKSKDVFALYQSGDSVETKNLILKYLLIATFIFGSLIYLITTFSSGPTSDKEDNTTKEDKIGVTGGFNKSANTKVINIDKTSNRDFTDLTLVSLNCSSKECSDEKVNIPINLLQIFIDRNDTKLLYRDEINFNLTTVYLEMTNDFYNYLLPKEIKNGKETNSATSIDMPLGISK